MKENLNKKFSGESGRKKDPPPKVQFFKKEPEINDSVRRESVKRERENKEIVVKEPERRESRRGSLDHLEAIQEKPTKRKSSIAVETVNFDESLPNGNQTASFVTLGNE